mmetsp:Transcript_7578/g.21049  ORF Transcript_7578/g.21049 Transcript_7578/m.21049 type:complete len:285 (+) Transcript_7578:470-1324(+)
MARHSQRHSSQDSHRRKPAPHSPASEEMDENTTAAFRGTTTTTRGIDDKKGQDDNQLPPLCAIVSSNVVILLGVGRRATGTDKNNSSVKQQRNIQTNNSRQTTVRSLHRHFRHSSNNNNNSKHHHRMDERVVRSLSLDGSQGQRPGLCQWPASARHCHLFEPPALPRRQVGPTRNGRNDDARIGARLRRSAIAIGSEGLRKFGLQRSPGGPRSRVPTVGPEIRRGATTVATAAITVVNIIVLLAQTTVAIAFGAAAKLCQGAGLFGHQESILLLGFAKVLKQSV